MSFTETGPATLAEAQAGHVDAWRTTGTREPWKWNGVPLGPQTPAVLYFRSALDCLDYRARVSTAPGCVPVTGTWSAPDARWAWTPLTR